MKSKRHRTVPEELWIPCDSPGSRRHLTEEELDLLFDWNLSPLHGHAQIVIARTSWELNKNDLVLIRPRDYDYADIGIFVGFSGTKGKPMFACVDNFRRRDDEIDVIAGTGYRYEYEDFIEDISLEALKKMNSDYFDPEGLEELKAAILVIENHVEKWLKRRRNAAATVIQRWIRHCLYKPDGLFGKNCVARLYKKVAELNI